MAITLWAMKRSNRIILGIETSCDDTSICLLQEQGTKLPTILSHHSYSQQKMLETWGGVVPEVAARNHLAKLAPLLKYVLNEAQIKPAQIEAIGVTTHPGLLGPLLTGINAAKTLALRHQLPLIPVNHLFAHLEAIFLSDEITYPYLGLLVSGGHSIYFLVRSHLDFEVLGTTIDDAAGEAFDKGGKLLNLGYPAGKIIDDLAKQGNALAYTFPIGMEKSKDCMLSFSGVKSSLRFFLQERKSSKINESELQNICASYQKAIIDALVLKLKFAQLLAQEKVSSSQVLPIVVGGGVACNSALRSAIQGQFQNSYFVRPMFCTDNGAMIANYALRTFNDQAIAYPECLFIDAKSRYIDKKVTT